MAYSYSTLKQFDTCPRAYLHKHVLRSVKDKYTGDRTGGMDAHAVLEKAVLSGEPATSPETPYCASVLQSMPAGVVGYAEAKLAVDEHFAATEFFSTSAWLRGMLDYLAVDKRTAVVLDWKFGKRYVDMFQLDVFALLVFRAYNVQTVRAAFVWEQARATDKKTYTSDMVPQLASAVLARVQRIEDAMSANNWPMQPSPLCKYCPVDKSRCSYGRDA